MKTTSVFHQLAKGTIVIAAINLLRSFRSFLLVPMLAKSMSTAEYGVWVGFETTFLFLLPLVLLGLDAGLVRYLSGGRGRRELAQGIWTALRTTLVTGLGVGLICVLLAPLIAKDLWGAGDATVVVRWLGILVVFRGMAHLIQRFFYARQQINLYGMMVGIGLVVELGFIGFVASMGYGVVGVVQAVSVFSVFFVIVGLLLIYRQVGWERFDRKVLRQFLSFGLPLMPSSYFYWLADSSDRFVIGHFHGAVEVSVYSLAYTLGNMPYTMLLAPLHFVMYPQLISWWDEGKMDRVQLGLESLLRYSLMLMIPAVVGLSLLARPIILLMSTEEFAGGAAIVPWIGGAFIGMSIWVAGHYLLCIQGRTRTVTFVYGLAGVGNLGLNLLFVSSWGPSAAAWSSFLIYWLLAVIGCLYVRRSFFFQLQWQAMLRACCACVPMALFLRWAEPIYVFQLSVCVVIGAVCYVGSLWAIGGIGTREWLFVRSLFNPSGRRA